MICFGSPFRTEFTWRRADRRRPEVRALARLEGRATQSSFEASQRWLAPPAITATPLRRDDGFSAEGPQITKHDKFNFENVALVALRHSEFLSPSRNPFMAACVSR